MDNAKITKYKRLLAICIAALVLFVALFCFSDYRDFPSLKYFVAQSRIDIDPEEDFVRFIDVGQGDSILISSNGYHALIDFGNQSDFGNELLDSLRSYGVTELDCVIISHYDTDHVGGAAKIIGALEVYHALLPEQYDRGESSFDDLQYALENNETKVYPAKVGTVVNIGEFEITLLNYNRDADNENDKSLVLMAEIEGRKFLFTGDAGVEIEKQLLNDNINVDCDVFKAAHHGSRNSNSKEFITAASPSFGVISVGASNQYGHPHEEVLSNLTEVGAKVYRTDRSGDITFKIEDGNIKVETEY